MEDDEFVEIYSQRLMSMPRDTEVALRNRFRQGISAGIKRATENIKLDKTKKECEHSYTHFGTSGNYALYCQRCAGLIILPDLGKMRAEEYPGVTFIQKSAKGKATSDNAERYDLFLRMYKAGEICGGEDQKKIEDAFGLPSSTFYKYLKRARDEEASGV